MTDPPKTLVWMGSSRRDLADLPEDARRQLGIALFWAQKGATHPDAKPMGAQLRGVTEIVADHAGDTYRVMYNARIGEVVYVLHAFQKKSKRGITTPQAEIDLIVKRLKDAREHHKQQPRIDAGGKS
ncbi:MAG: type II toxin-antitoxin system RelE/ParE family toxin [Gemmatimonadales bacterium]|nr:type II toxin-antitoxin system RelE/ParE family toxin [Gemmatimonadales bacterium]